MGQSPHVTITYSGQGGATSTEPSLRLEQQPVSSGHLTMADITAMLSLVRSGVSAKNYRQNGCEASVVGGAVIVPLVLYVWPSDLGLQYTLSSTLPGWLAIGEAEAYTMERDFDLVVPMSESVQLPFVTEGFAFTWQTPCYNEFGEVVGRPSIEVIGIDVALSAEVFGVLRVRCIASGYRHRLSLSIPKVDSAGAMTIISELDCTVTATWPVTEGTLTDELELALPGCVADLLESCPDGSTPGSGGKITDQDELVPTVYYNPCDDGQVIELRYEHD